MARNRFSWRQRGNSFRYAFEGIRALFQTEHNAWIHGAFTVVVITLAFIFKVSRLELMLLILAMAIVWITEIINTAIEKAMDFVSAEKHPKIKLVKDLAAAAVLVSAVAAFLIGLIIFLPKIL